MQSFAKKNAFPAFQVIHMDACTHRIWGFVLVHCGVLNPVEAELNRPPPVTGGPFQCFDIRCRHFASRQTSADLTIWLLRWNLCIQRFVEHGGRWRHNLHVSVTHTQIFSQPLSKDICVCVCVCVSLENKVWILLSSCEVFPPFLYFFKHLFMSLPPAIYIYILGLSIDLKKLTN